MRRMTEDRPSELQRSRMMMQAQAEPQVSPQPEMTLRDAIAFVLYGTSLLAIGSFFVGYWVVGIVWLALFALYFLIWPLPQFDAGLHDIDVAEVEADAAALARRAGL